MTLTFSGVADFDTQHVGGLVLCLTSVVADCTLCLGVTTLFGTAAIERTFCHPVAPSVTQSSLRTVFVGVFAGALMSGLYNV